MAMAIATVKFRETYCQWWIIYCTILLLSKIILLPISSNIAIGIFFPNFP